MSFLTKCDEAKPTCEYCRCTRKECVYQNSDYQTGALWLDVIKKESLVNSPSLLMGLSRFELRLLHFFDNYCILQFTFGVNLKLDKMWRCSVPPLFRRSQMVRNAIFLYSCINMWPLCEVEELFLADQKQYDLNISVSPQIGLIKDALKALSTFEREPSLPESLDLYTRTLGYFSDLIKNTQDMLLDPLRLASDSFTASELMITSIILYLFLWLHPHKLLPILLEESSLKNELKPETTDFISVCRSLLNARDLLLSSLSRTEFRAIVETPRKVPLLFKKHKFAIIVQLEKDLEIYYEDKKDMDSLCYEEIETIRKSLDLLASEFYHTATLNYPLFLFRRPLRLPQLFDELLRNRHFFALRVYFQYSCIVTAAGFYLYQQLNMWIDYMKWFRDYNMKVYGDWIYSKDQYFYKLVTERQYRLPAGGLGCLYDFDPELVLSMLDIDMN